jgi:hypothetical protein
MQCEALPITSGLSFVALFNVQFTKLGQLVKNCSDWITSCDDEYFEKQELSKIIKDFDSFYQRAVFSKRSAPAPTQGAQFHKQTVVALSKRFVVFQVRAAFSCINFHCLADVFCAVVHLSKLKPKNMTCFLQPWLFKSNLQFKINVAAHIMISATSSTEQQLVQIIVAPKQLTFALHEPVVLPEVKDKSQFLKNVSAEALALASDDVPLSLLEQVCRVSFRFVQGLICNCFSGTEFLEYACCHSKDGQGMA